MVVSRGTLIWPFLMIMVLHGLAIFLFTRGFLLTRTELPHFSTCSDISDSPCVSPSSFSPNLNQTQLHQPQCWTRPVVDRLVIIVLDALRFDFVAPSTCFEEKKPWMDKLQVLQKLASTLGSSVRIFKAISDPPTTSLQRLKGLTTGGLPTFIDVGNSFGAPAIIEDNLIYQLVQNGKRVVMMGDDTWLQLFPHHFEKSYPFPSFNVKDLDTVDNGCIDHLIPSLYQEDWDVLIAHFLGVDHAGHIFGVDSTPMIEKLEQYNGVLENVIEVLESQSGPGGLHENTLLLVMGDHGQTLNGDHGGGTAEEVETSIFAMSLKKSPSSVRPELDTSSRELHSDRQKVCNNSIQQLDFAVTVSAMLGIPFPFGSIGRVDSELYALSSGTWNLGGINAGNYQNQMDLQSWMHDYVNLLCINSWQVKRYIDVYSASSVIGFSPQDLLHITDIYAQAEESWTNTIKNLLLDKNESRSTTLPLKRQIDAYSNFLANVAELARSKWTEFNLKMMGIGLGIMLTTLVIQFLAIKTVSKICGVSFPSPRDSWMSFGLIFSVFIVAIRACSFLSNSYILEEGKVAIFLLATTGIIKFRNSVTKKMMLLEAVVFLLLIFILRFTIELGLSKQAISSGHTEIPIWMYIAEIVSMLALALLTYFICKSIDGSASWGLLKYVIMGTILSYILVAVHWTLESNVVSLSSMLQGTGTHLIPRIIYTIGIGQLFVLALGWLFGKEKALDSKKGLILKVVAMLSAWSSTVIILSGKQGPLVALASIVGGWCIMRLEKLEHDVKDGTIGVLNLSPLTVTQWSLLAVILFFTTGHWCAFDGLRYGAAFIGFDEFILIRQAILLTIDTFGFSLILPILGLPILIASQYPSVESDQRKRVIFMQLSRAYLIYGLITATTVTFTIICVTIQRRHLMVWGLFAPKFVFDVVGLMLSDVLILLASVYYFG